MRQLLVQVPRGCGKNVLEIAKDYAGANLAQIEATGSDGLIDLDWIVYKYNLLANQCNSNSLTGTWI